MNINQHIKRLNFTIGKGNKPNQTDINSFNEIVDWIERQRSETIGNNHLFAKLYIYFLNQFIDKHETVVFDEIPEKELHRKLDMPLDLYFEAFTKSLNDSNRYRILRTKGVAIGKHPNEMTEAERGHGVELEDFKDVWKVEDVTENLRIMIVDALNKFQ